LIIKNKFITMHGHMNIKMLRSSWVAQIFIFTVTQVLMAVTRIILWSIS